MKFDTYGIVNRWSGVARRGTLANLGWSIAAFALIAFVLSQLVK